MPGSAGYDIGASISVSTSSSASITAPFSVQGGGGSSAGNTATGNRSPGATITPQQSSVPAANNLSSYLPWIIGGVAVVGALLLAGFLRR